MNTFDIFKEIYVRCALDKIISINYKIIKLPTFSFQSLGIFGKYDFLNILMYVYTYVFILGVIGTEEYLR